MLMSTYSRMDRQHCRRGMSGAEGWVWYNCARQNKATVWGTGGVTTTPGYVKQEWLRLMEGKV